MTADDPATAEERVVAARVAAAEFDAAERQIFAGGSEMDHAAWAHRLRAELVSMIGVMTAPQRDVTAPPSVPSDDTTTTILAAAVADAIAFREEAAAKTAGDPESAQDAPSLHREHQDQADRYRALARQLGLGRRP